MGRWARKVDENDVYKISEESAEELVREVLDHYEIDPQRNDPEQEKIVEETLNDLLKAYRRGALENRKDDNGLTVIQHLKNGKNLEYRELGGKDRICMEGFDNTRPYSRSYAILGKLCGLGEDAIMKLKGQDWKTAETLAVVFMMV